MQHTITLTADHNALTRSEPDAVRFECSCGAAPRYTATFHAAAAEWSAHVVRASHVAKFTSREDRVPENRRLGSNWDY